MGKFSLQVSQMVTAEVTQAKALAGALLRWETRGPGDTENAMRRLARRHGIEYGQLWSLRYRAPKRIWADVLTKIALAYEAERDRQLRALKHETELTASIAAGADLDSVSKARAVLRQAADAADVVVVEDRQRLRGRNA
ncbi:hypothetical protein ACQKQD_18870 [Methylobacterium sp. NPDC080182]|uniref:hypothetical protein n=1 Tax=Methylobacterium sp. NPDC080182 TaxID=3390590 RepID=UPI003D0666FE